MTIQMRHQFGDRKHGIVPQPARHGAGMPGLAEAFDRSMPHVAANPRDDTDGKFPRNQHRTLFDMAIAVGVLTADRSVPAGSGDGVVFFGELGLDGRVRPVRGVLPGLVAAAKAGFGTVLVAPENAAEAALVPRMRVI